MYRLMMIVQDDTSGDCEWHVPDYAELLRSDDKQQLSKLCTELQYEFKRRVQAKVAELVEFNRTKEFLEQEVERNTKLLHSSQCFDSHMARRMLEASKLSLSNHLKGGKK